MEEKKVSTTSARDIWIAVIIGVMLVGFLVFGVLSMSKRIASASLRGTIVEKEFVPEPQTQITIGRGGVQGRRVQGDYILKVRVASEDRTYNVWVDEKVYEARKVGDDFMFPRPTPARLPTPTPD